MKRLLALVLTLCMALSILPAMAETTPAANDAALNQLLKELFTDIEASVASVDLSKLTDQTESGNKGSNYAVFEKVLENFLKENGEDFEEIKQALDFISSLDEGIDENTQETAEAIFSLILLGLAAQEEETKEDMDPARAIDAIMEAFFQTLQENDAIVKAVEDTGSQLFEMIAATNQKIHEKQQEGNGPEAGEKPFEDCEAELAKIREALQNIEDIRQRLVALDMLDLFHEIIDDIHESIDGHTHEDTAERVNTYSLLDELINTIQEAVMSVDIADIKEKAGDQFETDGGVFDLYEKVLSQISDERTKEEKEVGQDLVDMLAWLASLEEAAEVTNEEASALFNAIAQDFQGTREEEDHEVGLARLSELLKAVFETLEENQQIMDAVTASGSKALDMLTRFAEAVRKDVEETGALYEVAQLNEELFQEFESELAKVTEYLESNGGEATIKSIRFLNLVDTIVHEVHNALSGHEHAHE